MFYFSKTSEKRLATCHDDIQVVMKTVIQDYDFTIVCGYRDKEAQERAFQEGNSRLHFPDSKHNQLPSLAVDIAPYKHGKIAWDDTEAFHHLAGRVLEVATLLDIHLEWGGDWKKFPDLPHFELFT